jgi:hypothetical protein
MMEMCVRYDADSVSRITQICYRYMLSMLHLITRRGCSWTEDCRYTWRMEDAAGIFSRCFGDLGPSLILNRAIACSPYVFVKEARQVTAIALSDMWAIGCWWFAALRWKCTMQFLRMSSKGRRMMIEGRLQSG